jgi:hypothetical protein
MVVFLMLDGMRTGLQIFTIGQKTLSSEEAGYNICRRTYGRIPPCR